jgi:CheY-like chemotaxis protein
MENKKTNLMRVSKIAEVSGILPSKIRFYTHMGLLCAKSTTRGGHKLYDKDITLQMLGRIKFLMTQGRKIEDMRHEIDWSQANTKVLVIDDEPMFCESMKEMIKANLKDFEVKTALDGFSAGSILNSYLPDLILVDVVLPGSDGYEICRQIKSKELFKRVKVVLVTGHADLITREKMEVFGVDGFMLKPVRVSELLEGIASLTSNK